MAAVGDEKPRVEHVERLEAVVSAPSVDDGDLADEKDVQIRTERTAGEAIVAQQTAIPLTGERIPTSKLEYIVFAIFCELNPTSLLPWRDVRRTQADSRLPKQRNADWLAGRPSPPEAPVHGLPRQQQEGHYPLGRNTHVP